MGLGTKGCLQATKLYIIKFYQLIELHRRQDEKSCRWEHLLRFHAQFESQVDKMPDQKWNKKISLSVTRPRLEFSLIVRRLFRLAMHFTRKKKTTITTSNPGLEIDKDIACLFVIFGRPYKFWPALYYLNLPPADI